MELEIKPQLHYKTRSLKKVKCVDFREGLFVMEFENWSTYKVDPLGRRFSEGEESELDIVGEWSEPQPLKLELGKFYQAENGEVGECIDNNGDAYGVSFAVGGYFVFNEDGTKRYSDYKQYRIAREVPNPNQPAAVWEREVESEAAAEVKKPPLGIKPKHLFDEKIEATVKRLKLERASEILNYLNICSRVNEFPKVEYIEEFLDIFKELQPKSEAEPESGRNFTKLEIDAYYKNELGQMRNIVVCDGSEDCPFQDTDGHWYSREGKSNTGNKDFDLIRKIN